MLKGEEKLGGARKEEANYSLNISGLSILLIVAGFFFWVISWVFEKLTEASFSSWFDIEASKTALGFVHFLVEIFRNISIAIAVALFVGILIENGHRVQLQTRLNQFLKNFSDDHKSTRASLLRDMFSEAFKANFGRDYKNEVFSLAFGTPIFRGEIAISYQLRELDLDQKLKKLYDDYLRLECTLVHTSENISNEDVLMPIRLILPSPRIPELYECVKINSYKTGVNSKEVRDLDREKFEKSMEVFYEDFKKGKKNGEFVCGEILLKPGEKIYSEISYDLVKEAEDNEVFRTMFPSTGMSATIVDATNRRLLIDAEAIHPAEDFEERPFGKDGDRIHSLVLKRHFIPYQGITVYWKKRR